MIEGELRWWGKPLSPDFKELKIVVISDLHYGNPLFSYKHFKRTLDYIIEKEDCYCFLNGDMCESSIRTSKGDIYKQVGSPQDQRDWVIEQLEPVRGKVLGVTTGNHEARIYNESGMDISKDIADALGAPYRAEGMLAKIMFGDNNNYTKGKPYVFKHYFTHGYGGARTKSAKAVKVERIASWVFADFISMSHDHVVNVAPDVFLMDDPRSSYDEKTGFLNGKITAKREILIKTNAYLKWGGYSEQLGFPPVDLSTPLIMLLTPESPTWGMIPEKPSQAVKVII
jgi:hypothetical protein